MNQQQQKLLQLLLEVDEICKANGIEYYLAAGGALGAIRQGKFMPWDDDIDVFLTRANWEKLKDILETDCPKGRKLIHKDNTPYYRNTVARYVDLTTIYLNKLMMLSPEVCSIAVEFFILDPFPKDPEEQENHIRNLKVYAELLYYPSVLNKGLSKLRDDFDLELYRKYEDLIGSPEEEAVLTALEKEFTKTTEEDCDAYCMRWGRIPYLFPKENMEGSRTITFEGHEFPALQFTEQSFRSGYGDDWMYLPEAPEQRSHAAIYLEDQEESARFTMTEEDRQNIFNAFKERKKINLQKYECEGKRDELFAGVRAKLTAGRLCRLCANVDLQKLLEDKQFDALNRLFEDYYRLLDNPYFNAHNIEMVLPNEIRFAAAENLVFQGRYFKVGSISEDERVQEQIAFCRSLSAAIYDEQDLEKAEGILDTGGEYRDLIDYARGRLWCLCQRATDPEGRASAEAFAEEAIETFGRDGELLCYEGQLRFADGDEAGAKAFFEEGVQKTRNGFLLRAAEELCGVTKPADDYSLRGNYEAGVCRLLKAFDRFCRDCGADYQITGIRDLSDIGSVLALLEHDQVELAMFGEDLQRLEKTVNEDGTGFFLERLGNNPKAGDFTIRFYDLGSCVIDLRDYETHSKYGMFLTIHEIEKKGGKAEREMLGIMTDAWLRGNIRKYMKRRKKTRLKAKVLRRLGAILSRESRKRRLLDYKQKHFGISKQEAASGSATLRIGENEVSASDLDKTYDCYIEPCDMHVPISLVCSKGPAKAQLRLRYERRFRTVNENDPFETIMDQEIKSMIESSLEYHHQFEKKSKQVAKYAGIIEKKWREIKDTYGLQTQG